MNFKKITRGGFLLFLTLFLAGCVGRNANGEPTGIIWDLFGHPMENAIYWFANALGNQTGTYAWGIIIVTIITRIILTPLNINFAKTNTIQQERLSYIKPEMDYLNKALREATTTEEQFRIRREMTELQQAAGINLMSIGGCLPMFIQIPLFSALYVAVISSPTILNDVFWGIPLSQPSLVLSIVSSLFYLIQGFISQYGMTAEQKAVGRSMIFMSPILNFIFASVAPAGAAIYWTIGGIFSCLTTLYTSFVQKPKIKREIALEMEKNPIKIPKRKDVTATSTSKTTQSLTQSRRNEGKQKH